jgi:hypothetical protein
MKFEVFDRTARSCGRVAAREFGGTRGDNIRDEDRQREVRFRFESGRTVITGNDQRPSIDRSISQVVEFKRRALCSARGRTVVESHVHKAGTALLRSKALPPFASTGAASTMGQTAR